MKDDKGDSDSNSYVLTDRHPVGSQVLNLPFICSVEQKQFISGKDMNHRTHSSATINGCSLCIKCLEKKVSPFCQEKKWEELVDMKYYTDKDYE